MGSKMISRILWLFVLLISTGIAEAKKYDATIMGRIIYSDGLCRIPITIGEMVKDHVSINYALKDYYDLNNVPTAIKKIIGQADRNQVGNVLLFADALWSLGWDPTGPMPKAHINIAYSMLESSKIPQPWVAILNKKFDAVVVPDDFLVEVYKNSGVLIPVFVLPIGLYIDDFLQTPIKQTKNDPFVFGMTAGFGPGKNHELVLDGFIKAFGNNPKIRLQIHGRWGSQEIIDRLNQTIRNHNLTNVQVIQKVFSPEEYVSFMRSLDCYILVSKGEGFSITPREALALGIPCVISNNTAHKTICKTNLVTAVECKNIEKAIYEGFGNVDCGNKFGCTAEDLAVALKKNYENYNFYLSRANQARQWAAQYSYKNLAPFYQTLLKPKKVILGSENSIHRDYIVTSSQKLFRKYKMITKGKRS